MKADFFGDFSCVSEGVRLASLNRQDAHKLVRAALGDETEARIGVYSWVLTIEDRVYIIYIGKTKDLERRLTDYLIPFQVHAPNDFKLQFFQDFVFRKAPSSSFTLFFRQCSVDHYSRCETELCRKYRPLINERSTPCVEDLNQVKDAFKIYYDGIFTRKVSS